GTAPPATARAAPGRGPPLPAGSGPRHRPLQLRVAEPAGGRARRRGGPGGVQAPPRGGLARAPPPARPPPRAPRGRPRAPPPARPWANGGTSGAPGALLSFRYQVAVAGSNTPGVTVPSPSQSPTAGSQPAAP